MQEKLGYVVEGKRRNGFFAWLMGILRTNTQQACWLMTGEIEQE